MEPTSPVTDEDQPWWQVDLERDYRIDLTKFFNRTDKDAAQLKNFRVSVLDQAGNVVREKNGGYPLRLKFIG